MSFLPEKGSRQSKCGGCQKTTQTHALGKSQLIMLLLSMVTLLFTVSAENLDFSVSISHHSQILEIFFYSSHLFGTTGLHGMLVLGVTYRFEDTKYAAQEWFLSFSEIYLRGFHFPRYHPRIT